jgi:hypothetical protein
MHHNATYIDDILLIHHPPMPHLTTPTPRVGEGSGEKEGEARGVGGVSCGIVRVRYEEDLYTHVGTRI